LPTSLTSRIHLPAALVLAGVPEPGLLDVDVPELTRDDLAAK
jgi:hypothetical protein